MLTTTTTLTRYSNCIKRLYYRYLYWVCIFNGNVAYFSFWCVHYYWSILRSHLFIFLIGCCRY